MYMKKKTKKVLLISAIVIVVIFASVFSFQTLTQQAAISSITMATDCDTAVAQKTFGAQEGECFVYTLNNFKTVEYVKSVTEKWSLDGSKINGCNIAISGSSSLVFTCDYAYEKDGSQVQVCSNDLECPSENCVNWMCKAGLPRSCSITDSTRCYSDSMYQKCLSNGQWSGRLTCASGLQCLNSKCQSQVCNSGETKCLEGIGYLCSDGWSWEQQETSSCDNTPLETDVDDTPEEDLCPGTPIQCSDGVCRNDCAEKNVLSSALVTAGIAAGIVLLIIGLLILARKYIFTKAVLTI